MSFEGFLVTVKNFHLCLLRHHNYLCLINSGNYQNNPVFVLSAALQGRTRPWCWCGTCDNPLYLLLVLLCFAGRCWKVELEGSSFYLPIWAGLSERHIRMPFWKFLSPSAGPLSITAILFLFGLLHSTHTHPHTANMMDSSPIYIPHI